MRRIVLSVCMLALMAGCATSMKMSATDVGQLQPDEGVVFGSVLIRKAQIEGDAAPVSAGEGGKAWNVSVFGSQKDQSFSIKAPEGVETPFVTKLVGGKYIFSSASASVNLYTATLNLPLRVIFSAEPGKVLYIGRLVIEMTDTKRMGLTTGTNFKVMVQNARESTEETLEPEYGKLLEGAGTELMTMTQ